MTAADFAARWPDLASLWPNASISRLVRAGGIDWHVQLGGEGPVVLLLHGTGSASFTWGDILPRLLSRFTVVAPDLPGHGLTGADSVSLTLDGMARACATLIRTLGLSPAMLVAHSAGVAVALRMTLDRSVSPRLILGFNPALVPPPAAYRMLLAPLVNRIATTGVVARQAASLAGRRGIVDSLLQSTGSRLSPERRALYQRLLLDPDRVHHILTMMAGWSLGSLIAEFPAIACPVTLFRGKQDSWIPAGPLLGLVQRMPHATLAALDGGHLLHEEHPDTVAQLILEQAGRHQINS